MLPQVAGPKKLKTPGTCYLASFSGVRLLTRISFYSLFASYCCGYYSGEKLSLDYTETLMAAAGHQAEEAMQKTMKDHYGEYVLCVRVLCQPGPTVCIRMMGRKSSMDILHEAAEGAKADYLLGEVVPAMRLCAGG
ncbi:MAG: hypothetical protein U5K54_11925 [Cytophagales bacterium]|nr:hypothetical protein [Cytophagales bacterium]